MEKMLKAVNIFGQTDGKQEGFLVPIVQELAAMSLKTLPERYIRSEQERPSLQNRHNSGSSIPTIDMSSFLNDSNQQNEMKKLALACQEWGFFQVVNHGVPESLMKRMKGVVREFFLLPLEEKLKSKLQGIDGYGHAFVASDEQKLDWVDLMLLSTHPPQTRNMAVWPTKPADFRETVDQYSTEIQRLGDVLLRLLAKSLGLQSDGFIAMFEQRITMNYYPPCPDPDLALGVRAHSDSSGITILLQDDDKVGLQIRKDGEWIFVHPIPNALVINMGDMIEVMSNGRFKSIEHRAVTSKDKDRISIATFISNEREAMVGPAAELIDEMHPCEYRHFKRLDYVNNSLAAGIDGRDSIQFAKMKATN